MMGRRVAPVLLVTVLALAGCGSQQVQDPEEVPRLPSSAATPPATVEPGDGAVDEAEVDELNTELDALLADIETSEQDFADFEQP